MTPFVDVVVVLWKSVPYLEMLFNGLETLNYPYDALRVHFVDNGSGDGSLDEVRNQMQKRAGRLPVIEIYEPGENLGFSGGNNLVMKKVLEAGRPYVYLLNPDASFEPDALVEAVRVAEDDALIGSVQSLLVLQNNPSILNGWGNEIHALGFGYCGGYKEPRYSAPREVKDIAYASGAAVLYKMSVLHKVGLLDNELFMYHEDLDLGWRIWLVGFRNVLAPKSVVQHCYEFSRSTQKWFWIERNRWLVVLKNYRIKTLILLAPFLIFADIGLLLFSVKGGWWKEKLRTYKWFFRRETWSYIRQGRKEIGTLRVISDAEMLKRFTPNLSYQEFDQSFIMRLGNPIWRGVMAIIKLIVIW